VLVSIEAISPERTFVVIRHVIAFAIHIFERVRAWQTLSGFETGGIEFGVCFITLF